MEIIVLLVGTLVISAIPLLVMIFDLVEYPWYE
jgi:hypothetical protein